ncbi:hypothetical protein ACI3KS_09685 [Microbacterium sp. ZW T5_45]|uniref:hypothetical protein n=1 Tax=Microbacterium sp. ZW T5_45 TaxID=3378080 RepID=UPI003851E429
MTLTEAQTTKPAVDALTDLVDTARTRAVRANAEGDRLKMNDLLGIADTLDRARTRLVEDGTEYLDAAWAFVDAGRKMIADVYGSASLLALIRSEAGRGPRG